MPKCRYHTVNGLDKYEQDKKNYGLRCYMISGKVYVIPLSSTWICEELGYNPFDAKKLIHRIMHSNSFSGSVTMPNGKTIGLKQSSIELLEIVKLNVMQKPTEVSLCDPNNPLNDPDEYDNPLR